MRPRALVLALWGLLAPTVLAQQAPAPITLTLDEAIEVALVQNHALRSTRLDVETARAQVREAWSAVLPEVALNSSYTRNIKSPNPFAGSDAGGLFSSLGFVDWLAYNERARTDDNPGTDPISFEAYGDSVRAGYTRADISLSQSDNPFGVANQFSNSVTVTQTLFSGAAFAAIKGAQRFERVSALAVARQGQLLADQVRREFFGALLAEEQARVVRLSVERAQRTESETARRVLAGTVPKFQRLSAEVQRANLETQLVQAENAAALALDALRFTIGIPADQPVRLRGEMEATDLGLFVDVSSEEVLARALETRPDVEQARLAVELRDIDRQITRAGFFPSVSAFASFGYNGSVPDNRTRTFRDPADPDNPFAFAQSTNGFFSDSYWQPSINAGVRLSWNLFSGYRTSAQVQQRRIAVDKAQIEYERLVEGVRLEVERALRDVEAARTRILSQEQNVGNAELNYSYAEQRLSEGVATQLEVREASELLDQSRLGYLQAVYDYLTARSALEAALGAPARGADGSLRLTTN